MYNVATFCNANGLSGLGNVYNKFESNKIDKKDVTNIIKSISSLKKNEDISENVANYLIYFLCSNYISLLMDDKINYIDNKFNKYIDKFMLSLEKYNQ